MTAVHPIALAFPHGAVSDDVTRQKLAEATPLVLKNAHDIDELDFQAVNAVAVPWVVTLDGVDFTRYPAGDGSLSDYMTTLVAESGECYRAELSSRRFVNVLDIVDEPPIDAAIGDRFIASIAPTGEFAAGANKLYVLTPHGWEGALAEIGFSTYVIAAAGPYHYTASGTWEPGNGTNSAAPGSVGARELESPWGMTVISETAIPPGTRISTAMPTMPLGGTAADINDNTTETAATTNALGNLTGLPAASRVIAKLDLGSVKEVAAVQAEALKCSAGNGNDAFYYSTDDLTLTALGAAFAVTTAEATAARSEVFSARYIYLTAEEKDWSTTTQTIGSLNAYTVATSLADGTKVLVAANAIGVFALKEGQVAEAWSGVYRFYVPYDGATIRDLSLKGARSWDTIQGKWISSAGLWVGSAEVFTASGNFDVETGAGAYDYSATPPAGQQKTFDLSSVWLTARKGARLRAHYSASNFTISTASGAFNNTGITAAIYIDGAVAATAHFKVASYDGQGLPYYLSIFFYFDAPDDGEHEYKVAFTTGFSAGTKYRITNAINRRLFIEKAA